MIIKHKATTGKTYYLHQHIQLDDTHFLLLAVENSGKDKFQKYVEKGRTANQSCIAETGDELILSSIEYGETHDIDSGIEDVDDSIRERLARGENLYANLNEDGQYELDLETVSNDRKNKLWKIIGIGDTHPEFRNDSIYQFCYICILNVKPK